jgi:hypothetical protein
MVSKCPNIMVAVDLIPRPCRIRMTPSHSCVVALAGEVRARTRSERISAPPPGMESIPASRKATRRSWTFLWKSRDKCTNSGGEKAWRVTPGWAFLMAERSRR